MSFRIRGSPPFMPNHLTPKLWTSSTKCKASFVVNSLGACAPDASTLQYLQRALQAPVALQEVISNGPLFAKLKFTFKCSFGNSSSTLNFSHPKKDYVFSSVHVF